MNALSCSSAAVRPWCAFYRFVLGETICHPRNASLGGDWEHAGGTALGGLKVRP